MHQNKDMDKRINCLLSGLEKILSAIAEMRNIGSDSHGVGARRINISETKTILISIGIVLVLAILTIPCFLYEPLNLWIRYSFFKDPSAMNRKADILFKQKDITLGL